MRRYIILPLCACAFLAAAQKQTHSAQSGAALCAPLNGQSLNCPKLGFTYQVPVGWVDRTAEMQSPSAVSEGPPQSPSSPAQKTSATSQTLLAIFERPPQAVGQTINSAVLIAAESRADYPQVKTAADYFAVISDLAETGGLKSAGDPYSFTVGGKQLVREDFQGEHGKLPVFQSTLVILEKGTIVSFTFIAGSEDEVDRLIENLRFGPTLRAGSPRK